MTLGSGRFLCFPVYRSPPGVARPYPRRLRLTLSHESVTLKEAQDVIGRTASGQVVTPVSVIFPSVACVPAIR